MKLIVGLGNPGFIYAGSRHNLGFSAVKALAKRYKASMKKERSQVALSGRCRIEGEDVILAMPLSFMNLSGPVVKALIKRYAVDLKELLVVLDDLDLEFGRIRLRQNGSSGGHKGLASIIASLGSPEFSRLRLGIGRPEGSAARDYVLTRFNKKEKERLQETMKIACDCCRAWVVCGTEEAMNVFNKKME
ncbi:MAG TPA: aminoacyl-tRNA hydrolase [Candidatus Margulisiibacteriota bacterium]|nr:aminoacyl-tRNA hydrolase [Candidatus Margulisiibacteriota bacterium]